MLLLLLLAMMPCAGPIQPLSVIGEALPAMTIIYDGDGSIPRRSEVFSVVKNPRHFQAAPFMMSVSLINKQV